MCALQKLSTIACKFDLGCVLPHGAEHGCEGEEGGHGHARPAGDGLGRQEQRQPGHDDEQPWAVTPVNSVNTHTWLQPNLRADKFVRDDN